MDVAALWTGTALTMTLMSLGGCAADTYARRADRAAFRALDREIDRVVGNREATASYPEELPPEPEEVPVDTSEEAPEEETPQAQEPEKEGRILDLRGSLEIAVLSNRSYLTRQEALFLEALAYTQSHHAFTPQLNATLGYVFANGRGGFRSQGADLDLGVSQILPWGGTASIDYTAGFDDDIQIAPVYSTALSVSLVQPLLRGFGREVALNNLIQAERDLMYEIRAFELFREDFTIDVATRFYDLVQRKQTIDNLRNNLESFVFGTRQAEALFKVGRTSELDVLRARRSELNARDSVISAEEANQLALDRFRIFLGLPPTDPVDVAGDSPPFTETRYDLASSIEIALENRLDLLTRRQQLEDVERAVRITRNGLLPDLDLAASTGFTSFDQDDLLGGFDVKFDDYDVAVTLGLPVDRVDERSNYRRAQIAHHRAIRDLEEFTDNLVVEIQSAFRELQRRRQSLDIQSQLIEDQSKNLRIAEIRFERGEIPNRDVVEANQSLLDAQNALINEQVNYEIARLELLRNLGILFIDDNGMWK